ncbi:Sulfotransferase family protein [compost metagenome]
MKTFIHIPKTAGVTVREILTAGLRSDEILHIEDPNSITENFSCGKEIRFIHGHIDISQAELLAKTKTIYTFLRDPLERAISEYNFIQSSNYSTSKLPTEQAALIDEIRSISLDDYLTSTKKGIRGRVQNAQLFYLSGDVFNPNISLRERFETACRTIDNCKFVGILEDMEESITLLTIIEKLPPNTPTIRNSSKREKSSASSQAISIFKERNKYDYEIYKYARNRMKNDLQHKIQELALKNYLHNLVERPALSGIKYSFDMPLEGDGWHTRETNGSSYWRFTGPGQKASLYFPRLSRPVRTITFKVVHAITPAHFAQLQVLFNGHHLGPGNHEDMQVKFSIPLAAQEAAYTCIEIITPPAQKPETGDNRKLGIAFSSIEID